MKITIHQPAGFNEKGNRSNNEDAIYPLPGTATAMDTLFLVCDGVGGEHKGEVASAMACQSISNHFSGLHAAHITQENIQQALDATQKAFERTEQSDPETHGMATTMTMLFLGNSGVVIAHLGDSRVYQVRNGKIIFQTKDHKWVNELVESGVITEEQAREHPKRNVITRVISADRHDQPDFKIIQDVQPEDYFFMCTDGVLEKLYDELLEYHLRDNPDNRYFPEVIIAGIKEECEGKTNDNFSAYLIKVESVHAGAAMISASENTRYQKLVTPPVAAVYSNKSEGVFYTITILVGLLLFAETAFYFMQKSKKEVPDQSVNADSLSAIPQAIPVIPETEIQPSKTKQKISPEILYPIKETASKITANNNKTNKARIEEEPLASKEKPDKEAVIIPKNKADSIHVKEDTSAAEAKPAVVKTEVPVLPRKNNPDQKKE